MITGLVSIVVAGVPSPPTAVAACAMLPSLPHSIRQAKVVFVGVVGGTDLRGTRAAVRVTDVWKGKGIQRHVVVDGWMGSESREFRPRHTYLFLPLPTRRHAYFRDNLCTATREYSSRLDAYRPAGAHRPG
jgi:hypothetical protein